MLSANGYSLWLIGGAVRDIMAGLTPRDFDFATDATPDKIIEIFSNFNIIPMGKSHGTVTVYIENEPFEITATHYFKNGRLVFSPAIELDLAHRDFTINAMAMSFDGTIIDPFCGKSDLDNGIVRFVGNPEDRIKEDPLRMIRFFRFDNSFRKYNESETDSYAAIADNVSLISKVSGWRLWNELYKCLASRNADEIVRDLYGCDLLREIGLSSFNPSMGFQCKNPYDAIVQSVSSFGGASSSIVLDKLMKKFEWTSLQKARARIIFDILISDPSLFHLKSKIAIRNFPKKWVIDALVLIDNEAYRKIQKWSIPEFPLDAQEVDAESYAILKCKWAESGFRLNREQLLSRIT